MAEKSITTDIDDRKLKLSNLDKVLFPSLHITKAEVIKYFLDFAHLIIPFTQSRPLTLIRFPDGVDGKRFYSKNKPSWTPSWVASTKFPGDEENQYLLANDRATLVWIANLAGLELHPMNVIAPHLERPNQFIFDLDPSDEFDFPALKELAYDLKTFLESYGYTPFIKTSGSKGLHIYVPILSDYGQQTVFQSVKQLATQYVNKHGKTTTLKISKEKRKGKVLLDIYRNHKAQSCVSPFSLRGKTGAPISTPFPWKILDDVPNSQFWNLKNIQQHIDTYGNAWDEFTERSTSLHDHSSSIAVSNLEEYASKRDFVKTSEPGAGDVIATPGNAYVVQLHDASNLHYDLRLEYKGTLESWAIPKGLPHCEGIKRLAIRTEDHPLKYLTFEGTIPKGQYGGGQMWIFDRGTYSTVSRKKSKIHFQLLDGGLAGEYTIYNTGEDKWLIEKMRGEDTYNEELLKPMLSASAKNIPEGDNYSFEIKWDGIRAIFVIESGEMKIFTRNGNEITNSFPEITENYNRVEAEKAILDGELVYLNESGTPDFSKIVGRIHMGNEKAIKSASKRNPVTAYMFDLIYLDGKDCRQEDCQIRRKWLQAILKTDERIRYSESFEDGKALLDAIASYQMEGVLCKVKAGKYLSGIRSDNWIKVKVRHEDQAFIIGWTEGEGDRSGLFGALHLGKLKNNKWQYMGKVGTGFDSIALRSITDQLLKLKPVNKPIQETIDEPGKTHWVEAKLLVDISYASLSSNSTYREPVFIAIHE